ncbi:MAG: Modification methylase DsaV (EC [uncultured Sulfurovum sp.]|uniref:Modification methylase DsaV (EC) n=1 Tax=uncultured Sulfurovum sp. TaxID=269237 RepID=A0A6S6RYG5_9BACT|nr:MAG: Modification methylase DsaV (EC [uncultured Sulfurovum sp.]
MDYKNKLLEIYDEAVKEINYREKLTKEVLENITILSEKCFSQKGVYTVFVTLSIYKILHKQQDIRNHQTQIANGFSARTIDTNYITPTLKALGLPSMAETGWLTRSLEQPYPYTLDYEGKISNKKVKKAFLELLDTIEVQKNNPKYILVELLRQIIIIQQASKITINPLQNPEKLTISKTIEILDKQFSFNYKATSGSKLPVLAFYAVYQILIDEVSRYNRCHLKKLGSHTASDKTSKSAGDIELFENEKLFEAIEIKLDKAINSNILRIAREKIVRYDPKRYYILSYSEINEKDKTAINEIIEEVKNTHGCQIVVNGVLSTLKYYMRLISDLEKFITIYSNLIEKDTELKTIHKEKWNEFVLELSS